MTCCHSKTLNIFVQSYLKTIQKLLECPDPQMQVRSAGRYLPNERDPVYLGIERQMYRNVMARCSKLCEPMKRIINNHTELISIPAAPARSYTRLNAFADMPFPLGQILASQSFVKFANIREETPTYHLSFDFFVSKFCSMAHSNGEIEVGRGF